jgi:hypothetical protein
MTPYMHVKRDAYYIEGSIRILKNAQSVIAADIWMDRPQYHEKSFATSL